MREYTGYCLLFIYSAYTSFQVVSLVYILHSHEYIQFTLFQQTHILTLYIHQFYIISNTIKHLSYITYSIYMSVSLISYLDKHDPHSYTIQYIYIPVYYSVRISDRVYIKSTIFTIFECACMNM